MIGVNVAIQCTLLHDDMGCNSETRVVREVESPIDGSRFRNIVEDNDHVDNTCV